GDPPLLLLVGAPPDDHWADLPEAVGVVDARSAIAGHRLGVDDRLRDRGVSPTPRRRPTDRRPPALVELALPGPATLHRAHDAATAGAGFVVRFVVRLVVRVVFAGPLGQELREVVVEPRRQLVA